ncbi:DUF1905 domain-containing protein [Pseudactinotalea sp. Z1748]|uniref:DUF1905 domain-containing protein n=1 Tax=Pseudactinotalea sp. Z1748 TaxID=3413027 RepID=UPI003C7DBF00
MTWDFEGEIWYWRGPAPFYFVTVPESISADIHAVAADVSYGWGAIPVRARIGATTWQTSMFPKGGMYALPVKVAVRRAEQIDDGDLVSAHLELEPGRPQITVR